MRTLIWSKTFVRALRRTIKKHPALKQDIEQTLRLLTKDPFAPQLETHKLTQREIVGARKGWRVLWGGSPHRERVSHPPVLSLASCW